MGNKKLAAASNFLRKAVISICSSLCHAMSTKTQTKIYSSLDYGKGLGWGQICICLGWQKFCLICACVTLRDIYISSPTRQKNYCSFSGMKFFFGIRNDPLCFQNEICDASRRKRLWTLELYIFSLSCRYACFNISEWEWVMWVSKWTFCLSFALAYNIQFFFFLLLLECMVGLKQSSIFLSNIRPLT